MVTSESQEQQDGAWTEQMGVGDPSSQQQLCCLNISEFPVELTPFRLGDFRFEL